jgi:Na+:H+ antiporter, NhaC family
MTTEPSKHRAPTLVEAMIPLIAVALLLGVGYGVYHLPAEILLLAATAVAGAVAWRLGYSWREQEAGIVESIAKGTPATLIVIVVGALIGSWIAAGTIPMLVYYGLKLISPSFFLVTACIVCSAVSLLTGTSWGTVGTIGVAFIAIAQGLHIPLGQAAGAIVAGAYFGDKLSPFSDTTNLAPLAAGSNLYDHIRHTLWTTLPAWLVGLAIYTFIGLTTQSDAAASMERALAIQNALAARFTFSWSLLIPPLLILGFIIRKKPIIPGMLLTASVATILACVVQGTDFKTAVRVMLEGYVSNTGDSQIDKLLSRGGMEEMVKVSLIVFCSFGLGGVMRKAGMLEVLLDQMLRFAHTRFRLILSAVASSISVSLITGSSFLSILLPGELFAPAFKKAGLAAKNLSRTTEDSGAIVVPMIPWSAAGVFMAATLGVPTLEYAPWAILCYGGFIAALFYGWTGIGIAPRVREDETQPGS